MRMAAIRILEILHGFLILSSICVCVLQMVAVSDLRSFLYGLLLLPIIAALSAGARRVPRFWQYALIAAAAETVVLLAGDRFSVRCCLGVLVGLSILSHFAARAGGRRCWLDEPAYPWLLLFFPIYLYGSYFERPFLMSYASISAGMYFLICDFHVNLTEMEHFVRSHQSLQRLPVNRLARTNSLMLWGRSGLIAAAMIFSPYVGFDRLIRQMGRILRSLLVAFFSLFSSQGGSSVNDQMAVQQTPDLGMGAVGKSPWWLVLLYKFLDILAWILSVAFLAALVFFLLRYLYRMYCQFNARTEENGDRIERLTAIPAAERKKKLKGVRRERLFWDRSANGRIRGHYKRRVLQDLQQPPRPDWTPRQVEEQMSMPDPEKSALRRYYEKARYGKEACTKDEMKECLKL